MAPCARSKTSSTLLTRAGFSGPDALHIYRALFGFLHGHVLNELQELVENPDETDDLLRLGLHRLPIGEFPLLRSLAPALASYDGAAELERGLDILLHGTYRHPYSSGQYALARRPARKPTAVLGQRRALSATAPTQRSADDFASRCWPAIGSSPRRP